MSAITVEAPEVRRGHLVAVAESDSNGTSHPGVGRRWTPLVIRLEVAADAMPLRRLAHLDSARPLNGQAVLAEQAGELVAAVSLEDGRAIADPFVATSDIISMLRLRVTQLSSSPAH